MLLTRAPVATIRRRAAPRLACVRPIASVHPEPGSNSSLYICYMSWTVTDPFLCQQKQVMQKTKQNTRKIRWSSNCSDSRIYLFLYVLKLNGYQYNINVLTIDDFGLTGLKPRPNRKPSDTLSLYTACLLKKTCMKIYQRTILFLSLSYCFRKADAKVKTNFDMAK